MNRIKSDYYEQTVTAVASTIDDNVRDVIDDLQKLPSYDAIRQNMYTLHKATRTLRDVVSRLLDMEGRLWRLAGLMAAERDNEETAIRTSPDYWFRDGKPDARLLRGTQDLSDRLWELSHSLDTPAPLLWAISAVAWDRHPHDRRAAALEAASIWEDPTSEALDAINAKVRELYEHGLLDNYIVDRGVGFVVVSFCWGNEDYAVRLEVDTSAR